MTDKDELKSRLERASKKILLVGDIHLMDTPPRNASPSYTDDIFAILEFTAKLEHELELDAVVWAGDVFHHKAPSKTSHRLMIRAVAAANAYRRLLIVTGNHDITNDRLETLHEQQPLGVLLAGSKAEELDGWDVDMESPIYGVPWQQDWFADGKLKELFTEWRSPAIITKVDPAGMEHHREDLKRSLVVTHAPIFPPGQFEDQKFEVLHPSDFAAAMDHRGSLYYGHIHEDHGIYEVDGVHFANVGAISRGSIAEYNVTRKIKAALWTPEDGFLELDLPHKPAAEVLQLEQASMVKEKKISDERFLEEVGSTRLEISSTAGVIAAIQEMELAAGVKKVAIELLEEQSA